MFEMRYIMECGKIDIIDTYESGEDAVKQYLDAPWEGDNIQVGEEVKIVKEGEKLAYATLTVLEFDRDSMVGTIEVHRPGVETYTVKVSYAGVDGVHDHVEVEYL